MLKITKEQMDLLESDQKTRFIRGVKEHIIKLKSSINKNQGRPGGFSISESSIRSMLNEAAELGFTRALDLICLVEFEVLFDFDMKQAEAQLILLDHELPQDEKMERLACLVFQPNKKPEMQP